MPIKEEIVWVLSGGRSNRNINNSLGGEPSTTVIMDGLNNLFDDVTRLEMKRGNVDYRCFYVKNGSQQTWQNIQVYIKSQVEDGAFGYLGVSLADDEQQFSVIADADVTGGYFTFDFDTDLNVRVDYDSDLDTWAANFETALKGVKQLRDVQVTGHYFPDHSTPYYQNKTFYTFRILFLSRDGKRNQPIVKPNQNNITGTNVNLSSDKVISGAPCNSVAVKVAAENQRPNNVIFNLTSKNAPIQLGDLKPNEYVPIWLMRENFPGDTEKRNDKITVAIRGASTVI